MALWNNNGYFYGDFSLDGTRYRPRLRDPKGKRIPFNADPASPEYQKAGRAEERAMERAERGELAARSRKRNPLAGLPFAQACQKFLEERRFGLARLSIRTEQERSRNPKLYFGKRPVNTLDADDLREYVIWRKGQKPLRGDAPEVSNRTVNMEVAFVRRLLKRAGRLRLLGDLPKFLRENHDVGARPFAGRTREATQNRRSAPGMAARPPRPHDQRKHHDALMRNQRATVARHQLD